MSSRPVRVVPYDAAWPGLFEAEREGLLGVLTDAEVCVHHIGSTSVPGLAAKPVLDLLLLAPSLEVVEAATPALVARGYDARGEYGIPGRRYFSRPAGPGPAVHLHAFASDAAHAGRHLLLRDYLRTHPAAAAKYGALKTALAGEHAEDRDAYQAAFVESLLEQAAAWHDAERGPR